MSERSEGFGAEHLDECAYLLVATFNAEPWSDQYTQNTARKQSAWHLRVQRQAQTATQAQRNQAPDHLGGRTIWRYDLGNSQ